MFLAKNHENYELYVFLDVEHDKNIKNLMETVGYILFLSLALNLLKAYVS
jgi:hypothetical protein